MRLASWNINGLRARLDFVRHWLEARRPDVVGLQELKLADEDFPADSFRELGYQTAAHGQKSWNGVAILSRDGIEVTQRGLPGHEDLGARLLTASTAGVHFTTVYVPNGKSIQHPDFGRKLNWLEGLRDLAEAQLAPDATHVLCGDFNICPAPIDSWNEERLAGHIFHTEEERGLMQAVLDCGFVDSYREHRPAEQKFSWWDYRSGAFHKNQGLRIDLVLLSAGASSRIADAAIDRDYRKKKEGLTASDHAPVWVDLED